MRGHESFEGILVANRGEIAVRIWPTLADLGRRGVAVHAADDGDAVHVRLAPQAVALPGRGVEGYLDAEAVIEAARSTGCQAIHPGYGFLSEQPAFAEACEAAGIAFIGPSPAVLQVLGDKAKARALARDLGIGVLDGSEGPVSLEEAAAFLDSAAGPVVLKAVAGGGGRGLRVVERAEDLAGAYQRCRSEATAAFGDGDLLVERYLSGARHVEVQIAGDSAGAVVALGDRDCSIQRRHQKVVELAPAPNLSPGIRQALEDAATRIGLAVGYRGLGTVEFLVDPTAGDPGDAVRFLEVNPRLQVEHTVTEEVTGLDLVAVQIRLAEGATLADLGLGETPATSGVAVQARVYAERMAPDGSSLPSGGTIARVDLPSGPGIRVDHGIAAGDTVHPGFDPLLAKVIARGSDLATALRRGERALGELVVTGVDTNVGFLARVLAHPDMRAGRAGTDLVDTHASSLVPDQPLGTHGNADTDTDTVTAPLAGTVVAVDVAAGDEVPRGGQLLVIESMKMEHVIVAPADSVVVEVASRPGDLIAEGELLVRIRATGSGDEGVADDPDHVDLDAPRADLDAIVDRHAIGLDEARPEAVERRHATGHRTARENLADLVDPDSFVEYGPLVIAAQRRRRELQELIERTPADGLVGGIGRVNGRRFGADRSRCVVMSYDYMVLAGTQGHNNHIKKDRLFELAEAQRLPVVLFAEGGGGRPGDTDTTQFSGLATMAFHLFGRLSGTVPLVGIAAGRCFAGNAALLGCCDVIIATQSATIGMGGPAMIEGGGLGSVEPDDIGPLSVQVPNGVVDVPVADEAEAVAVAKQYLSYFQGPTDDWECADQRALRHLIPENRVRVYDLRRVIDALADTGSVLELRRHFGVGIVTALVRIEGRPMGLIANNPAHLGGAIDHDAADKAARFMQLCDSYGLPIVSLCDTPGFMVGPESERAATVRHFSRMFVNGANLEVPIGTVILRKAYGLGAQAMAGGSFKTPQFTVSWPTGELGGMGLEGAVKLGQRRELEAIEDPDERERVFQAAVARAYEMGKAVNAASTYEIDDVIDPADTRRWITTVLVAPDRAPGGAPRRPAIDTW
ncbi:MAG: carboxyl transferase domain-containing protein [Acidimicrobiales bacterium]